MSELNGLTGADETEILERLSNIIDPELGVNIVDLGLVYDLYATGDDLILSMTLTYAGCPLTEEIEDGVWDALLGSRFKPQIMWVFSPAWTLARATPDGRDQLRALGVSVDAVHASHG